MLRTADTQYGKVRGLPADDPRVTVFKGIPFAKPPVGKYRWHAPVECDSWEGEKKCYEFAPISMQDIPGLNKDLYSREFHVDPDIKISEDSLYLNIWTGADTTEDKLPVLVWIYGGAFQWGYTSEMEFNGERLARGGIIVVSIAYRLGPFGFLAHPDLLDEDPKHPANFGLLDQQAGLKWVYRNIAAFGGDPENITVAGQSAGGASVNYMLEVKSNVSMIKRACVFSGFIRSPFRNDSLMSTRHIEEVSKDGEEFIKYLGCDSIEEARKLDSVTIRDQYGEYAKDHPRFVPCIDNVYIKEDLYDVIRRGDYPDIPVMMGYTKDEFREVLPTCADLNDTKLRADVVNVAGINYFNIVQNCVREVAHDLFVSGRKNPVFTYKFAPSVPGADDPGAFHSCDLWFFFETIQKCWRPYNGMHYALARRMSDYWINFIKTSDPNGKGYDGKTLPVWKSVSSDDPSEDEIIFKEEGKNKEEDKQRRTSW